MSSKNSIILTRLLLQMALASILQSCGSADTIAILEEPKAVLGDQNKNLPLLSRVKAERIALLGKNLSLDFNNEKTVPTKA